MAWTNEQKEAIYTEGTNIIVSAGAGSGKTAVLTERVLRKLREGVNINELLILLSIFILLILHYILTHISFYHSYK